MATQLVKPDKTSLADPEAALRIHMRVFEAVQALQAAAAAASPESVAASAGVVRIVKIVGATVTDPVSGVTFTADVYVHAVRT